MHIQKIEVENFRGIRHWEEEFDGQNVRILGPNGTGKSSVIQAIEFVLTGDVEMLRGSGTQRVPFAEYASHVEVDPEETWVEASFQNGGSEVVTVRRELATSDEIEVLEPADDDELPDWLRRQMDAAELGHSILDRDRLLRFVSAPEGKRGDRIDELFRLEAVDEKRKALKRAVSRQSSTVDEQESKKKTADRQFFDLFPSGVSTRSGALAIINERREEHDAEPVESLDDDFTANVALENQAKIDPLQSDGTVSLLERAIARYDDRRERFQKLLDRVHDLSDQLQEEDDLERELNTLDLVESGLALVEQYDDECPLCLKDWREDNLVDHLEGRKNHAEHIRQRKRELEDEIGAINSHLVEFEEELNRLRSEFGDDYSDATRHIREVADTAQSWRDELKEGALTDVPSDSTAPDELFPESLKDELQALYDTAQDLPDPSSATENVDLLARADERYEELSKAEAAFEKEQSVHETLEAIHSHFQDARQRVLSEAFDEICSKFESYYEQMHQDEEAEDFSAVLEPTETGVRFEPKFYDHGHHHPQAVHSEGHRDSMGLALFLAMSDVGGEDIDILLLDDVVMSIDSGHRSNIATLLAEEIADRYQIVLTTHDKTWDRHLHLTQEFDKQVRFSKCSLEGGPLSVDGITDPWERIDHHLDHDDVTAAAAWIRKTVEWYSRRACAKLRADVPYHKLEDEELSIGRLFQCAIDQYESELEDGSVPDSTPYDQELWDCGRIDEELDALAEVKQDKDRHLNLLNANVHYNEAEAAFYTGEELRNERDVFRKAYELLYCTDCDSWVKKRRSIYCDCTIRAE